jgi:hypothetical protein
MVRLLCVCVWKCIVDDAQLEPDLLRYEPLAGRLELLTSKVVIRGADIGEDGTTR